MNATNTNDMLARDQRLWLDSISRPLLDSGTLARYVAEYAISGLCANPTVFDTTIRGSTAYDAQIRVKSRAGLPVDTILVELALHDLRRAADLFRPCFESSGRADGWVSIAMSPLLAADTAGSVAAAVQIQAQAERDNLLVKIPGTPQGLPAIEAAVYLGVPINVTLLFSARQYRAAAEAYMRGLERRLAERQDLGVASVASVYVSRWDAASRGQLPVRLHNRLGIAMAHQIHATYRELLGSARWRRLAEAGAQPQRLLWVYTDTLDPTASAALYVRGLQFSDTIITLPEDTLLGLADEEVAPRAPVPDGTETEALLDEVRQAGVEIDALASRLQKVGVQAFVNSWQNLRQAIADKTYSPRTVALTRALHAS